LFLIDKVGIEAKLLIFRSAQWFLDVYLLLFKLGIGLGWLLDSLIQTIESLTLAYFGSLAEESGALFERFDHELTLVHGLDLLRHSLLFLYEIIFEIVLTLFGLLWFTIWL
jgi:hypothetical protein